MSGQQPPHGGPRGWNPHAPSPSSFLYRPPSPWTPVAPSPPPIISGPRNVPISPISFAHAMSPAPQGSIGATGRAPGQLPHPRPQWPHAAPSLAGNQSPAPYQPPAFQPSFMPSQGGQQQTSTLPPKIPPSPTLFSSINSAGPFRPQPQQQQQQQSQQHGYGSGQQSSFQLSPTPSPMVCQTPNSDYMFNNFQTPNSHVYEQQQQQHQRPLQQPPIPRQPTNYQQQPSHNSQYEYVGVPQEPRSYVIYDDEEEYGPSTAEIIANQSQDYVDEKLAEYQMTILQLQGKL